MIRVANLAPEPDDYTEESVTITEAARRLGCSASTVRELLRLKKLSGHRVGKHAIRDDGGRKNPRATRVHAMSIRRYKMQHFIGGSPDVPVVSPSKKISYSPGAAEARRKLREMGIL